VLEFLHVHTDVSIDSHVFDVLDVSLIFVISRILSSTNVIAQSLFNCYLKTYFILKQSNQPKSAIS
jgi:hypothetical protein